MNLSNESDQDGLTLDSVGLSRPSGVELLYSYVEDPDNEARLTVEDLTQARTDWPGKQAIPGAIVQPSQWVRLVLVLRPDDAVECPFALGFALQYTQGGQRLQSSGVSPLYFYDADGDAAVSDANSERCQAVVAEAQQ